MAWSTVHTQLYSSNADNHTFLTYFFDTYLPTKLGWATGAHPQGSSHLRVASVTLPSPFAGGGNVSCYYWINWQNTVPSYWTWYEDATYTTVPGDLATDASTGYSGPIWSTSGHWRIWESSTDPNAILVTKGKVVYFFWPGPSQWLARPDLNWDGSTDYQGSFFGPYIATTYRQLMCANRPYGDGGSTTEYQMTVDVGYAGSTGVSILGGGPYWLVPGLGFMASVSTTTNAPEVGSMVAFPRTGADMAWFLSDNNTVNGRNLATSNNVPWTLLYESNSGKYWLLGTSDLSREAMALDMGTSEPDLS